MRRMALYLTRVTRLALPMATSRLLNMLSLFIGTIMLSYLGEKVLAASTLITAAQGTCIVIMMSLLFSVGVAVGQAYGAKDKESIAKIVQQGCLLALGLGVLLSILLWNIDNLMVWFHEPPQLIRYVRQFFHTMVWGAPLLLLIIAISQFYYGVLKQTVVITTSFISLLVFIPVSYAFIFGRFGMPDLGVAGLAIGFIAQSLSTLILFFSYAVFSDALTPYQLFRWRKDAHFSTLRKLLTIGWPICLQFGGEVLSFMFVSLLIGWLGVTALAATQVVQQFVLLFLVPIFAISEATGILIGHLVGSRRYLKINRMAHSCILFADGLALIVMVFFLFSPHWLAAMYLRGHAMGSELLTLIQLLFAFAAFNILFDSTRSIVSGALRGLFDTRYAMWVGILIIWCISVPLGAFLALVLHWGVVGFSIGRFIALFVGMVVLYRYWVRKVASFKVA